MISLFKTIWKEFKDLVSWIKFYYVIADCPKHLEVCETCRKTNCTTADMNKCPEYRAQLDTLPSDYYK